MTIRLTSRFVLTEDACSSPGCGVHLLFDEKEEETYCSFCDGWDRWRRSCREEETGG